MENKRKLLTTKERLAINLTSLQEQSLVGNLCGDGTLRRKNMKQNTKFTFSQSGKENKKEYFNHIYQIFKPLCTSNHSPNIYSRLDPRYNMTYTTISFSTMQLPCFNVYFD
jgi:hypothetical protein